MRKTLAVLVACIASAALALQLWLIVQAMTAFGRGEGVPFTQTWPATQLPEP